MAISGIKIKNAQKHFQLNNNNNNISYANKII